MSARTYKIDCGESVTIPANQTYEVVVTSEVGDAGTVGGADRIVPPPQWGALIVRFVTPPVAVRPGESIAEAAWEQVPDADDVRLPQRSKMVIIARHGELDVPAVDRLSEEVAALDATVEVQLLGPDE